MPTNRTTATILAVALGFLIPNPSQAQPASPCERWSPQISEHLDWVCAHSSPRAVSVRERPPAKAICWTMNEHISDLLNRHRRATEMDDTEFNDALLKFYDAQTACEAGRYDEALSLYTLVPVGRPKMLLR